MSAMRGSTKRSYSSFSEFWPHYVGEHRRPLCRAIHYGAAIASLGCVIWAIAALDWRPLLLAPVLGYGAAWCAHFLVERNQPATWRYVRWSLVAEYKMLLLALAGRMHREVERLHGDADESGRT